MINSKISLDNCGSTYHCQDCSYSSHNKRLVVNHVEAKHITTCGVQCQFCKKNCPTREALRKHISRSHKDLQIWTWINFITINQIFYFLESAVNLEDLKIKIDHKIVQLDSGLFQCTDCSYISKFRHNLPKHIEAKHIDHGGLICPICVKICSTRESLRRHLQKHSQEPTEK